MKTDYVNEKDQKYHNTFQKLHIPFLALCQLFIAYYRSFISGPLSYRMGMPRSFVLLVKQLLTVLLFLAIAYFGNKSFKVNIKSIPFIIITGMLYVAVSQQIIVRMQIEIGPFITA
jgi:hypothetical protein